MFRLFNAGAVACFMLAAVPSVHACGSGTVLLEDHFDTLQDMWGGSDQFMDAKDGRLILNEQDGRSYTALADPAFEDVDYCATVNLLTSSKISGSYGGIVFWAADYDNFYTFQITLDGYATVYRFADDDWTSLIDDRRTKSVHVGLHAANELRVVTSGKSATLYVNGQKFDTVSGELPENGQRVGFTVEAPEKGKATFALDDLRVNEVSDAQ